jgi:hypothetical protein
MLPRRMKMEFKRATKEKAKARIALIGPSGSGKTYTALLFAKTLGERIAVIDTEHGSASKYADFGFDVLELDTYAPAQYIAAMQVAAAQGYDVVILDSLSHAWVGKGGALEMKDDAAKRSRSGNSYTAWRDVTPEHNRLIDTIIAGPFHVIATMRTKTDYVVEKDDNGGKTSVRKIGLAPVQRDGMEYEFDVVADLDIDHNMVISKTRCPALDGKVFHFPGEEVATIIRDWLTDGVEPAPHQSPAYEGCKVQIVEAQRGICAQYGFSAADVKAATKVFLPRPAESIGELTEEEAKTLIESLWAWADDMMAQSSHDVEEDAAQAEATQPEEVPV